MKVAMLLIVAVYGLLHVVSGGVAKSYSFGSYYSATLSRHNTARTIASREYGYTAPSMSWNWGLANQAATYAETMLNNKGCGGGLQLSDHDSSIRGLQGENIAYYARWCSSGSCFPTVAETIEGWFDEKDYYRWAPSGTSASMPYGRVVGHYTQIIWASSTKLGCGAATCTSGNWNRLYVVCRYQNPGNYNFYYPNGTKSASTTPLTELPLLTMVSAALIVNIVVLAVIMCYRRKSNAYQKVLESNELNV